MTQIKDIQIRVLLWVTTVLLSVTSYTGIRAINSIDKMEEDIQDIKTTTAVYKEKNEQIEKRLSNVEVRTSKPSF